MQKRGRWRCARTRTRKTEQEARKEKTKVVGVLECEGILQRDSVHGCGMAARYSLNNITEVTRVASVFMPLPT